MGAIATQVDLHGKYCSCSSPFRKVSDLRPDGMTWVEALQEFEQIATPRVHAYIANIESIANRRELWETDLETKKVQTPCPDQPLQFPYDTDEEMADELAFPDNETETTDDSSHTRFEPEKQAHRQSYLALVQTNMFQHFAAR
jgi:hypothetical protein